MKIYRKISKFVGKYASSIGHDFSWKKICILSFLNLDTEQRREIYV